MTIFIITALLAVAGIGAIIFAVLIRAGATAAIGVALLLVGGTGVLLDSYTTVPVRTVGIETTFGGKPVRPLTNGLHWMAPWHGVDKEWDGSVQTLKLTTSHTDAGDPVTVRLANQTTAQVDVTLQWNIRPDADVLELYRRYKTFANVEDNLVKRQLQQVLNDSFRKYDPLAAVNGAASGSGPTVDQLGAQARTDLQNVLGNAITVGTMTIPLVHFDATTESRLVQYQQALADTRIAQQREQTAEKIKAANDILAGTQSTKDPGVQYQNCLNLIADLAGKGELKDLPPTFNCGGGAGQTPVIVGGR
jgi:hypothetical protein